MNGSLDRLYERLPAIYRLRDHEQGEPLRALLQVIAEQVNVVEEDIAQLYENWFIETCQDWVVPYIGDLIGYQPVHEAGEPGEATTPQGQIRNKILIPRREAANTLRYRRRKGTLALLELLANDVAGWPARAVEFYRLLGHTQSLNHLYPGRGKTADLRNVVALDRLDGPFDTLAHTVDVRRISSSHRPQGRHNIPSVGLFVWRLRVYPTTRVEACHVDRRPGCWTFSVLGNDTPLYVQYAPETDPTQIAGEFNLPVPIRRHAFERRPQDYYGPNKSLCIWTEDPTLPDSQPIPLERIVAADLSGWVYRPTGDQIAVDPELGRFAGARRSARRQPPKVWVTYHRAFGADLGGGEYRRPLRAPEEGERVYQVTQNLPPAPPLRFNTIAGALAQWRQDADEEQVTRAIVEIADSGDYVEESEIVVRAGERLELRAAQGKQPAIRVLNQNLSAMEAVKIFGPEEEGAPPSPRVALDGLLIAGRGIGIEGHLDKVTLRHCTLVPGWDLAPNCDPLSDTGASISLSNTTARLEIERCITGLIEVSQDAVKTEPLAIQISDSILDATRPDIEALSDPEYGFAHAVLTVTRSTVLGAVKTHAIRLAENAIFTGQVRVARRQVGCMRFCYVPPGSRTPRRYRCQPDLVEQAIGQKHANWDTWAEEDKTRALEVERLRVRPQFNSTRYGTPTYCQLALACADEIVRGADDESEMGAFHDLYQPQRAANLRARLAEYSPAGMDAGIIYAS